ncbi:TetR/AcrR family transcriptional regulator [Paracoccus benzoatiresistens]|uniref:TetR/AcrR family transcriptional regulator n=1 Tax=Paracoccus benzoatiresistens TaxID=2997341 RepID=A0ABT4J397_9RHOB|nr:TetR/AcrR family transcriptional regulator [Paracoccus sp. EF6]MCZ0961589.1 TetR/AcrR family transcriptional regulator [Paracoccus sp. EF6]
MTHDPSASPEAPSRRHAAGEDPRKREQILAGAWHEFMEKGFDAATMNGICRAAGVSKGTLYVYFRDKEDLFVALVEHRRAQIAEQLRAALAIPGDIEARLTAYAVALIRMQTSSDVLRAQRIVVAMAERMPDLARRFYDAGARQVLGSLGRWLIEAEEAGLLRIPDAERAAQQFTELAMAGVWRQCLFGLRQEPPDQAEIDSLAADAVRIFMAAHRLPGPSALPRPDA